MLWDHAELWGLLLCRGLSALRAPFVTLSGADLADGALARYAPPALLVPGGFSRRKMRALGAAGAAAVREYVAGGGGYFGVCGGAGLALSRTEGLSLCPWVRRPILDRLEHLVSGHVRLRTAPSPLIPPALVPELVAPVWWPSGFVPAPDAQDPDGVTVLARYAGPAADLLVADMPLGAMSGEALAACRERFGVDPAPAFLDGGACLVTGLFGKGRYVLSHAHLETPGSPQANHWLSHVLTCFAGGERFGDTIAAWEPDTTPVRFDDVFLERARRDMAELVAAGLAQHLLFRRTSWLVGWRPGLPGFSLTSLAAGLAGAAELPPTEAAVAYWHEAGPAFASRFAGFARRLEAFFPATRLCLTRLLTGESFFGAAALAVERRELFGDSPAGGGICGELTGLLDGLLWRLLPRG